MKRVLITGAKGMAGSHLADLLLSKGFSVTGIDLPEAEDFLACKPHDLFRYIDCDIKNFEELLGVFRSVGPDIVFHLAALAFVPPSWDDPYDYVETNIAGTVHVLECARKQAIMPIVQLACSSEEYGMVHPYEVPITKYQPFRPMSPYGVTKVATELFGHQYCYSYGLRAVVTRTFNHTGPRQKRLYVLSDFCAQAIEVKKGIREFIDHGNLETVRDFTDVRDIVRGYLKAVEWTDRVRAGGFVHQIGGGAAVSIGVLLRKICAATGLPCSKVARKDPNRGRPSDVPLLQCDASAFIQLTKWEPEITLDQTIADVLAYWDKRID